MLLIRRILPLLLLTGPGGTVTFASSEQAAPVAPATTSASATPSTAVTATAKPSPAAADKQSGPTETKDTATKATTANATAIFSAESIHFQKNDGSFDSYTKFNVNEAMTGQLQKHKNKMITTQYWDPKQLLVQSGLISNIRNFKVLENAAPKEGKLNYKLSYQALSQAKPDKKNDQLILPLPGVTQQIVGAIESNGRANLHTTHLIRSQHRFFGIGPQKRTLQFCEHQNEHFAFKRSIRGSTNSIELTDNIQVKNADFDWTKIDADKKAEIGKHLEKCYTRLSVVKIKKLRGKNRRADFDKTAMLGFRPAAKSQKAKKSPPAKTVAASKPKTRKQKPAAKARKQSAIKKSKTPPTDADIAATMPAEELIIKTSNPNIQIRRRRSASIHHRPAYKPMSKSKAAGLAREKYYEGLPGRPGEKHKEAIEYYKEAYKLSPKALPYNFVMAKAHCNLGRPRQADRFYRRIKSTDADTDKQMAILRISIDNDCAKSR